MNNTAFDLEPVNDIAVGLHRLPNNGKSLKAFAGAVSISTDAKSWESICEFVKSLENQKIALPRTKEANIEELKVQLNKNKEGIALINDVLESIGNIFKNSENVELDEPHTINFLGEVKIAQALLNHLIAYISYYIEVEGRKGEKKTPTYQELLRAIKTSVA